MFVNFNILNQLGSPAINSNTFANRPAAGQTGRLFVSTDTYEIYRDNGTTWDLIGGPGSSTVTGTGAATQVAYWTAAQAIGGSNNLWWDNTNGFLGVGTAAPTTRIEAVKTDGIGIYANFTTNAGSGSGTTGIYSINNTASSGYAAVIEERTANTTGGQYPLLVKHSLSTGTAAVGMGTGLQFQLPDDAGTFKTTQLTIETIDAAAATYKTRYRFNVQNNGSSTPVAYINSTGVGVFTATPSAALDIHSTGVIAALNSTGSTNNGYLAFQRAGAGVWRIGDTYNGGANFFELHNTVLTTDALQVAAATNKTSWQATETYTTGLARGNYFDFNLSVAAGGSFSSPNAITALGASLDLTLAGNATIPSGARSGLDAYNSISFTGTGTLTHNQGTQIRAYSNVTAGWAFAGSATGTITHLAGLRALFPDNTGSAVTITNNYALLLNDQTANTGTVTYTNRWGVYQEGASDLNYFAANTLIGGTTNAGYKLSVYGAQENRIDSQNNVLTLLRLTNSFGGAADGASLLFQVANLSSNGASITGQRNSSSFGIDLYFSTSTGVGSAPVERMRVTSTGLVGINTSTPSSQLEVSNSVGDTRITVSSTGSTGASDVMLKNTTGTVPYEWLMQSLGADGRFRIFDNAGASTGERFTILQDGKTGIGTNAPSTLLQTAVSRTNGTNVDVITISDNLTGISTAGFGTRIRGVSNSGSVQSAIGFENGGTGTNNESQLSFYTQNTAGGLTRRMLITSTGEVGINTATPGYTLEVNGNTGFGLNNTGLISTFGANNTTDKYIRIRNSSSNLELGTNATEHYLYGGSGSVPLSFFTNATARARITSGGNFLIGTTTDAGQKLQVNGDFYLKGFSGSSTFVLYQNYSAGAVGFILKNSAGTDTVSVNGNAGSIDLTGGYLSGAPTGGTAARWKLGSRVAATVVLDTTQYIELDVGGTLYKLAIVT